MLNESDIARLSGLTHSQSAARLKAEGYNELPTTKPRGMLAIVAGVVREPMFLLLIAVVVIYLLLGDVREALPLMVAVAVVIGITLYQEHKTERALEALRDLSSPRALVIRDSAQQRIAGREVVRGDLLVLNEGDRVPADARLIWSSHLSADESLLTGESVPVRKRAVEGEAPAARPGGDDLPHVYASTLIVGGKGVAEVTAIGIHTEIGRIGKALQALEPEVTPLQRETRRVVWLFAAIGLVLCAVVVIAYGLTRGDWLNGFLAGLTLAMAILPEEFPVVLTVFLALGAWRIARSQVLTRHMPAVETLGSATVLCVDKTGTLTQNRMSVAQLYANGAYLDVSAPGNALPENFHELVEYAILASQRDPFDPMEKALRELGKQTLAATEHLHDNWSLVREYPLSPQLLALSHVWQARDGGHYVIAAKGAPEAIMDLCHLDAARTDELNRNVIRLTGQGLRVLGVARASFREARLPVGQHDFDFEFLGFVGLADPIRPAVPAALAACYSAGIRVIMITGDYPGTARNIAQQIGLMPRDEILTGPELDRLSDDELRHRIKRINIFARVVPEQKLRIVGALKAQGEIVAMTGDGVNDAPALKSAHIGVAMGGRGTDVAREAADLVLLDDDFSSIVEAVRLGRRIGDNLTKAVAYIFAVHVPTAGLVLLPVLLGWPLVLLPIHVAFLELIIDPACSIVFEAEKEETNVMTRPPRPVGARLFDRRTVLLGLLQGLGVLIIVFAIYAVALQRGLGEAEARALTFTALVAGNLALILTNRSWSRSGFAMLRAPNPALWWVTSGTLVVLALTLSVPVLRDLFRFATLSAADFAFSITAGAAGVLWFELFKRFQQSR
ncbi:MAG: cation-translocating P-type ATPase [Gammaproteobacteria bacterium]|nr:cation-translocating P-type ATPase [Gammaproteobacteria bacterium]